MEVPLSFISAIITITKTIIQPVVWLSKKMKSKPNETAEEINFRKGLIGNWHGWFSQGNKLEGQFVHGELLCRFYFEKDKIQAIGQIDKGSKQPLRIIITESQIVDRTIAFEYRSIYPWRKQFGTIILDLSPNADKLSGKAVGYAPISKKIVAAKIDMIKGIKHHRGGRNNNQVSGSN